MGYSTSTIIETYNTNSILPEYIELLEKAEYVHGVGLALANVFISILALVLTVVGIVAAYLMWRNSTEQKKERKSMREQYHRDLEEAQKTYTKKLDELLDFIQKQAEERIKELGADGADTMEKINKLNEELREIKKATASAVEIENEGIRYGFGLNRSKASVCDECGKYFAPDPFSLNRLTLACDRGRILCKECSRKI